MPRPEPRHHRDQRQSAQKRDEIIQGARLLGGQRGFAKGGAGGVAGVVDAAPHGKGDILPVGKHCIPLAQHRGGKLAHRARHIADGGTNVSKGGAHGQRFGLQISQLFGRQRQFAHPEYRPHNGRYRQDRTDDEGNPHDHRNAIGVEHIARHECGQQARREIGQRLRQPGKRALREEPDRTLARLEPVGNIGAVWLHRDVVARVEDPQQAGCHPQRAGIGHGEQSQRTDHRADQEIGCAAAQPGVGAIAHRADNRLDDQPGHRACQPQQRHGRLVRAKKAVDRPHIGLLQPETELQAEKADIHFDDSQQRKPGLFRHMRLSDPLVRTDLSPRCDMEVTRFPVNCKRLQDSCCKRLQWA